MQIYYFVHSFADILLLNPMADESGNVSVPGLSLRDLDEGLCHGDLPSVHRVHIALLSFLARASLMHSGDPSETEVEGADASEFTHLDAGLSHQLLAAVRMHGAWPELVRRVAIVLGSSDTETLKSLHFGEYSSIAVSARARLLALLCDGALGTVAIRRAIDARMDRLEGQSWDWQTAARAGLVQQLGLHELPRPEPVGRDREHAVYWCGPVGMIVKQHFLPSSEDTVAVSAGVAPTYGSRFDFFDGDDTLRSLHSSLDVRGARESAMSTSLGNFIHRRRSTSATPSAGAAGGFSQRSRMDNLPELRSLTWPPLLKEVLQGTHQCPSCGKRVKVRACPLRTGCPACLSPGASLERTPVVELSNFPLLLRRLHRVISLNTSSIATSRAVLRRPRRCSDWHFRFFFLSFSFRLLSCARLGRLNG